jgi:hypothetical protein
LLAGVLWIASLGFTALVGYGSGRLPGLAILLLGWIYLINFQVPWLANVFFLWALFRLLFGSRSALSIAWIAVLLSLDTYRVLRIPVDEGGTETLLYGYGFGALLWFTALIVMGIAASRRNVESSDELEQGDEGHLLRARTSTAAFVACLIVLIGGTLTAAIWQRQIAAPVELQYLESALVKRGAVCTTPDIVSVGTIFLDGPLELVRDNPYTTIFTPSMLLRWGVPVVRENGVDYRLRDPDDYLTTIAWPSSGPAAATLKASTAHYESTSKLIPRKMRHGTIVAASLQSARGEIGFSGNWSGLQYGLYCPTLKFGYDMQESEPPRSLLLSAVRKADGQALTPAGRGIYPGASASLHVVGVKVLNMAHRDALIDGAGCPPDIAMIKPRELSSSQRASNPLLDRIENLPLQMLRIGDSYHDWPRTPEAATHISCEGDAIFLVTALRGLNGTDRIHVEKRQLPKLSKSWRTPGVATFSGSIVSTPANSEIRVQSVRELDESLVLVLAYSLHADQEATIVQVELTRPSN